MLIYRKSVTSQHSRYLASPSVSRVISLDLKPISPSSPVPRLEIGETPHNLPPSALHS